MTTTADVGEAGASENAGAIQRGQDGTGQIDGLFNRSEFDDRVATDAEINAEPVDSVAGALKRMKLINDAAPPDDGLAAFNDLYTVITRTVADWLDAGKFGHYHFLDRLDVAFANRYFRALRAWGTGGEVPKVWRVLLERRSEHRIAPIQFAVAGVNAHINYDLAPALVDTCAEIREEFGAPRQRDDYLRINTIFADKYKTLRDDFTDGLGDRLDEGLVAKVIDYFNGFMVEAARDEAWEQAERIATRRTAGDFDGVDRVLRRLDRHFGIVGRSLLYRGFF